MVPNGATPTAVTPRSLEACTPTVLRPRQRNAMHAHPSQPGRIPRTPPSAGPHAASNGLTTRQTSLSCVPPPRRPSHLLLPQLMMAALAAHGSYFDQALLAVMAASGCSFSQAPPAVMAALMANGSYFDQAPPAVMAALAANGSYFSQAPPAVMAALAANGSYFNQVLEYRPFTPCVDDRCYWSEDAKGLAMRRWYASNQIVPDGRVIVVGGRSQFNYEFLPNGNSKTFFSLPFLQETSDPEENNLYPFVHLNIDGKLFIFANNRAILFDYENQMVVRTYPKMPGGHPRNYPSTGSSVLLPIKPPYTEAEVLVCGGAPAGSYLLARNKTKLMRALNTCGRIKITNKSPFWIMESMPTPRVMGDMLLLPNGEVLLINGAAAGAAGWELGHEPVLTPIVYRPDWPIGKRFNIQRPSSIPRLYHSSAVLLSDGRVLVGGSNPHQFYVFAGVKYPTELSLEAFKPEYMSAANSPKRPSITALPISLSYGQRFKVQFTVGVTHSDSTFVTMVAPSFATHSFSMNQRLLVLEAGKATEVANSSYEITAAAPASAILAPPGYYMLFLVNNMVPSEGAWVHIE